MEQIIYLVILIFFIASSVVCYNLAAKNKLNTTIAALIGFFAPVLSIIIYLYIDSNLYKRLHGNSLRSSKMNKWSFIIGGLLLIFTALSSLGSGDMGNNIFCVVLIFIGVYLVYRGFKNK